MKCIPYLEREEGIVNQSNKVVTERDFRLPEYRDAKVEDYEFRKDGKLVRKDRWETAVRNIAYELDFRGEWEIHEIMEKIEELVHCPYAET